tara:strand:+ start:53 stop:256 length:204 start_codon:yes stop_codon:yes gene_type:complete
MDEEVIKYLIDKGWWIQVSPLAHKGWMCGLYKRGKKTGNWVTEISREFETPQDCYNWAMLKVKYETL